MRFAEGFEFMYAAAHIDLWLIAYVPGRCEVLFIRQDVFARFVNDVLPRAWSPALFLC